MHALTDRENMTRVWTMVMPQPAFDAATKLVHDAIGDAERRRTGAEREQAGQQPGALLVVEIELVAQTIAFRQIRSWRGTPQDDEPVRRGEGQRAEEDGVDDAEHS